MSMQTTIVLDRGRSGAARVAETVQQLPPVLRIIRRRRSRAEQAADALQSLPPAARIGLVAATTAVAIGLAYLARKRLFAAAAVVADVVEEAADTVEDTAEDLAEAARKRSESTDAG
jgi:hypothetical protein